MSVYVNCFTFTFQVGNNHDGGKESQFQISVSAAGSIIGLTTFFVLTFRLVSSRLEKCRREAISSDSAVYWIHFERVIFVFHVIYFSKKVIMKQILADMYPIDK